MVGLTVVAIILASILSGILNVNDATIAAEKKALAVTEANKQALKSYLRSIEQDLIITADNGYTKEAISDFTFGWNMIESDKTEYLHDAYLFNVEDAAERINTMKGNDGSVYSEFHANYHPFF